MASTLNGGGTIRGDLRTHLLEAPDVRELLIADKVAPAFSVQTLSGQYPKFTTGTGKVNSIESKPRAPGAEYPQVNRRYDLATFTLQDYGLSEYVDLVQSMDTERFFDAEALTAELLYRDLLLAHEKRVADVVFGSSFAAVNSVVAYTEANLASANPVRDIQAGVSTLKARGYVPNTIVLSQTVFDYITRTTLTQNFVKPYSAGASVVGLDSLSAALAGGLGLPGLQILIGSAGYNTSKTSTASITNIWANTHMWIGSAKGGDPLAGGAMRTFAMDGSDPEVKSWDEPKRESTGIRVRHIVEENVIDANAGYRVTTQYA